MYSFKNNHCRIVRFFGFCAVVLCAVMFGNRPAEAVEGIANPYDTAGTSKTETGTITGTAEEVIQVNGGGTLNVFGLSNTGYLGSWNVASGTTLATDNYGNSKESVDLVFGAGTITLNAATLKTCNNAHEGSYLRRIRRVQAFQGRCFTISSSYPKRIYV